MSDSIMKQALEAQTLVVKHRMEQVRREITAAPSASEASSDSGLEKACQEVESIFLSLLLKEMRNTINKSGFISGGTAENIYTGMLDAEISKVIAERGGIGLSKILHDQLGKRLEKEPAQEH
jgi:flagellar protein FlgJ